MKLLYFESIISYCGCWLVRIACLFELRSFCANLMLHSVKHYHADDYRKETDALGEVGVAKDALWGAQTRRWQTLRLAKLCIHVLFMLLH